MSSPIFTTLAVHGSDGDPCSVSLLSEKKKKYFQLFSYFIYYNTYQAHRYALGHQLSPSLDFRVPIFGKQNLLCVAQKKHHISKILSSVNALPSPVSSMKKVWQKNQYSYQYLHFYDWIKIHLNIKFFSILVLFFSFLCSIQKADAENKNASALEAWIRGTLFKYRKSLLPPNSVTYVATCQMFWTPVCWRNSILKTWPIPLVKGGSGRMTYR